MVALLVEMDAKCLYAAEGDSLMVRRMLFRRGKARMSSYSMNGTTRKMIAVVVYKASCRGTIICMQGLYIPLIWLGKSK